MRQRLRNHKLRLKQNEQQQPPIEDTVKPSEVFENGVVTEAGLRKLFEKCTDVNVSSMLMGEADDPQSVIFVCCSGLSDAKTINEVILPRLDESLKKQRIGSELDLNLKKEQIKSDEIPYLVFSGQLVIYLTRWKLLYSFDIADPPQRIPTDSNTEISIKGPRDAFVEELETNIALLRKRLRTNSFRYEQFRIGTKSETKVALLYINDFIRPEIVDEARNRLNSIQIETLFNSSQLEQILSDNSRSLFPLVDYTGRPDLVVDCLIKGRFAILVEGGPIAVIAPTNLSMLMKSPEDMYYPFYIVTAEVIIRYAGLMISLYLPGFWVALSSFNMEQLPFPLLATLVISRQGLPLPGPLEAFLMLALFEVFREAGIRLPKAVGQTIAVVGGIIVGDAVIRAGLASTTMLIVAALTAVATFTLVNQTLAYGVGIVRIIVLLAASFLGMYGFTLAVMGVALYLSKLESFGVPYLSPISPFKSKDILGALLKKPFNQTNRPHFIQEDDHGAPRKGDSS